MRDPHLAWQGAHIAGSEYIADQSRTLVHMKGLARRGDNTCGVLTTMLQQMQPVIEQLIDRAVCNHAYDAAHGSSLSS